MKKKLSIIVPSIILAICIIISIFSFQINSVGVSQNSVIDNKKITAKIYKSPQQKGGALFLTASKGEKSYLPFAKNLSKTGLSVVSLGLDKDDDFNEGKISEALKQLKSLNLDDENIVIVGFDVGGFELLKYLSNFKSNFAGAVFLSPYYEKYDDKTVAIDDGSYVPNVSWIKNLDKNNFDFPVRIISSTTDDYSKPQLMTMLYNHLSNDDIQRSVGAYSAKKGVVSIAIETGVLHNFVPISDNIFDKVQDFISNDTTLEITKINTNMHYINYLWTLIIVSSIWLLVGVFNAIKYKFTEVSMGIVSVKLRKRWAYFAMKIISIVISLIVMILLSLIVPKIIPSINNATIALSSFVGVSGILTLAFFKKFVLPKDTRLFKNNLVNTNINNLFLSFLVLIFNIIIILSLVFSGYFYKSPTLNVILGSIYILIMSFIGVYAYSYEIETIRAVAEDKVFDIIYELIILLPFVIIFLWYVVTAQYSLSFVAITNIIFYAVTIVAAFVMKEINGNRNLTSILLALLYTISVVTIY